MFISFVRGVFGKGGFCPGGFCPGVYVRGVFVLIPDFGANFATHTIMAHDHGHPKVCSHVMKRAKTHKSDFLVLKELFSCST